MPADIPRVRWLLSAISIAVGLLSVASAASVGGVGPSRLDSTQPNILVIVADDLGWGDVGWHGNRCKTPNLDRLARESVELDEHRGDWKLIVSSKKGQGQPEVFNLADDPCERTNQSQNEPARLAALTALLQKLAANERDSQLDPAEDRPDK